MRVGTGSGPERGDQYLEIGAAISRITSVDAHEFSRGSSHKEFQEAVEAVTDISALIRRMLYSSAQDDYTNLDYLVTEGIIDPETGRDMKSANGLRNRLVHEYDSVNDQIAYAALQRLMPRLRRFSEEVLVWLDADRT
ncbi:MULTISPECIES: DUF86 domain-containing protein [unclassified Methanoculleus]|uniref:type VII toxin-antitoxin system HepT family RNase toxin n=2 Tax=Methanoculleus TaxID=45989 RepID=UPI0025F87BA2|nr:MULTISPECIES: DUF86 domain-containing protein [unclassified Methanoculleus]MDD2254733.1 DUF86 domain-containing protein [Methanoculleus sp.]MDD2787949.1 DUF86 domain-containing protein [Methanoculleus sp.]MDD4315364.1 DUF86 domain-containing protein [Methanoculleus sp.]MDD4471883.1 DUF86 domain-containing protein [Methanoculleus sp.]